MMPSTVQMNAAGLGTVYADWGTYAVPTNGLITVDSRDVITLLRTGATYINAMTRSATISPAPRAGSAGRIVASVALSNGTLSIANQPDVSRQVATRVDPGTTAITAGTLTNIYVANDGTTTTDAVSLAAAASTPVTVSSSKGVVKMTSAIVTGLVGGASPLIQVNDTNSLSVMVDPGFTNFSVLKESVDGADETIGTVATAAASITPTTAPNATHTYGFVFGLAAPNT
jgi:hypothetical protein